jgi:hypothetical protein
MSFLRLLRFNAGFHKMIRDSDVAYRVRIQSAFQAILKKTQRVFPLLRATDSARFSPKVGFPLIDAYLAAYENLQIYPDFWIRKPPSEKHRASAHPNPAA